MEYGLLRIVDWPNQGNKVALIEIEFSAEQSEEVSDWYRENSETLAKTGIETELTRGCGINDNYDAAGKLRLRLDPARMNSVMSRGAGRHRSTVFQESLEAYWPSEEAFTVSEVATMAAEISPKEAASCFASSIRDGVTYGVSRSKWFRFCREIREAAEKDPDAIFHPSSF